MLPFTIHHKINASTVVNCLTDFLLALLPVPLLWQLKLDIRTRISLILILSLGIFAGVAGIIRAMVFNSILKDQRRFIHDKYAMWNYVELTVGIIAGSLPALKPLVVRFLNAARDRTTAGSGKASTQGRSNALAYHKQSDTSRSGVALSDLKMGTRASAATIDRSIWNTERGNGSEDSVLPLHGPDAMANAIIVTKDFHVYEHE